MGDQVKRIPWDVQVQIFILRTNNKNKFINKQIILKKHCRQPARLFKARQCVQNKRRGRENSLLSSSSYLPFFILCSSFRAILHYLDAWNSQNHSQHDFTSHLQDFCSWFGQKIEPTTDRPVLLQLSSPAAVDIYYTVFTNTLSNPP